MSESDIERYDVSVVLAAGATIEAESIEDALEKAKSKDWRSRNAVSLTVRAPETGEERSVEL